MCSPLPIVYVPNTSTKQLHVVRIACNRSKQLHTVLDARHSILEQILSANRFEGLPRLLCACVISEVLQCTNLAKLAHIQPGNPLFARARAHVQR